MIGTIVDLFRSPQLLRSVSLGGVFARTVRSAAVCLLLSFGSCLLCVAARGGALQTAGTGAVRVVAAIAYDPSGNLLIADPRAHRVFEATLGGALVVFAGTGVQGFSGDGDQASSAQLNSPEGVVVGPDGTVYIADTGNHRVRAVDPGGRITTVAGTGTAGFRGEGTAATAAALRHPTALAVDAAGALLLCDTGNHRLRRVMQGVISTVAGDGVQGFAGDGGPATAASLDTPQGLAIDSKGLIYIADTHNHRVRRIGASGLITTFAGTGESGVTGDGASALASRLAGPRGLAFDASGDLLIADAGNQRVRAVDPGGVMHTVLGTGLEGSSSDGVLAAVVNLRAPRAVALSSFGMPVIADTLNGAARVLAGPSGVFLPAALAPGRQGTLVQTPSPEPRIYGQAAVQATVNGAAGQAQGAITVEEAGSSLAASVLTGQGASFSLPALGAGEHLLSVRYAGDGLNPASQAQVALQVQPRPVTAIVDPVSMTYGTDMPVFSGSLLGVLPADSGAVVPLLQTSAGVLPSVGSYPLAVKLGGAKAANYSLSSGTSAAGTLVVTRAPSLTTIAVPPGAYAGLPMPLSVMVASTTKGQPTGTVQFQDGGAVLATASLQNGSATATLPAVPAGTRHISVVFSGDANFLPSSSSSASVPVLSLPDFSLVLLGAPTAQVVTGGTAKYAITVGANPGPFTGAVSLSASGLPAGASVSFSPPQVVPGTETATVTVAIQTLATSARAADKSGRSVHLCFLFVALVFCLRKGRRGALPLLCCSCFLASLLGCGARTVGGGGEGELTRTYALQITGTATNLAGAIVAHSVPISLVVQQ